jgi:hypothetical protein
MSFQAGDRVLVKPYYNYEEAYANLDNQGVVEMVREELMTVENSTFRITTLTVVIRREELEKSS